MAVCGGLNIGFYNTSPDAVSTNHSNTIQFSIYITTVTT